MEAIKPYTKQELKKFFKITRTIQLDLMGDHQNKLYQMAFMILRGVITPEKLVELLRQTADDIENEIKEGK
ncbi:hypothetical protein AB3329_07925 [Streptococcus sp. H31]|uniref:hypothetical protein n=1 Tax=Streptococcus huangxiaojuni TaxID=3237239 RepID=UPI0034A4692F